MSDMNSRINELVNSSQFMDAVFDKIADRFDPRAHRQLSEEEQARLEASEAGIREYNDDGAGYDDSIKDKVWYRQIDTVDLNSSIKVGNAAVLGEPVLDSSRRVMTDLELTAEDIAKSRKILTEDLALEEAEELDPEMISSYARFTRMNDLNDHLAEEGKKLVAMDENTVRIVDKDVTEAAASYSDDNYRRYQDLERIRERSQELPEGPIKNPGLIDDNPGKLPESPIKRPGLIDDNPGKPKVLDNSGAEFATSKNWAGPGAHAFSSSYSSSSSSSYSSSYTGADGITRGSGQTVSADSAGVREVDASGQVSGYDLNRDNAIRSVGAADAQDRGDVVTQSDTTLSAKPVNPSISGVAHENGQAETKVLPAYEGGIEVSTSELSHTSLPDMTTKTLSSDVEVSSPEK